jgi:hypothetical protein
LTATNRVDDYKEECGNQNDPSAKKHHRNKPVTNFFRSVLDGGYNAIVDQEHHKVDYDEADGGLKTG